MAQKTDVRKLEKRLARVMVTFIVAVGLVAAFTGKTEGALAILSLTSVMFTLKMWDLL